MAGTVWWMNYRNGDGGLKWHAWRAGGDRSVCGSVKLSMARRPGRVESTCDKMPAEGNLCRYCCSLLGLPRQSKAPAPAGVTRHMETAGCSCGMCLQSRKEGALRFVERLGEDTDAIACPCIQQDERSDPRMRRIIEIAEAEFAAALLCWEMTGGQEERREAGESRARLLDFWRLAAQSWATAANVHTCGVQNQRR